MGGMEDWIPFEDGDYTVVEAFLLSPDGSAAAMERAVLSISTGKQGKRHMSGGGLIQNSRLVELLDISDELDLLLDLGFEYKYLIKKPDLKGGKVFSRDVKSMLQFTPNGPWRQVPTDEFEKILSKLRLI